jgi:imidazolonepropionase-like amidohydrolase
VTIAAGSGGLGAFLVPGTSLHEELRLLVDAGLTPDEAIVAATGAAARVLGRTDLGTLAPGMLADFVVLDADPRVDIGAVRRIVAVVLGGRIAAGALPGSAAST